MPPETDVETLETTERAAAPPPAASTPPAAPTDWRATLPEDLRAEKSLESFKDVGALAKSWVSVQPLIGAKIPEGLTKEQVTEYLGKKGEVPAAPDKYTLKPPTFPEGIDIPWNETLASAFSARAHAKGLSNAEAQDWVNWWSQQQLQSHDAEIVSAAAERRRAETDLRQRWGAAYERNMGLARALVAERFKNSPRLLEAMEARGNDPDFVEGLAILAEGAFERQEIRGEAIGGGQSIEEIEAELTRIREDPKNHGNVNVVDKILALQATLDRLKERRAAR